MQTKMVGIVLLVIGVIMIAFTGFNYVTKKKVVDLGPIEINKEEHHRVQWPPIVGGLLIIGGIAIVVSSKKSS